MAAPTASKNGSAVDAMDEAIVDADEFWILDNSRTPATARPRRSLLSRLVTYVLTSFVTNNGYATRLGSTLVRLAGVQTIVTNTLTAIAFDTEEYDLDNAWAIGDPTKIYVPAWATRCRVFGNLGVPVTTSVGAVSLRLTAHKNNAAFSYTPALHVLSNTDTTDPASHIGFLSPWFPVVGGTDYVSMKFKHTDSASIDIGGGIACWFQVEFKSN